VATDPSVQFQMSQLLPSDSEIVPIAQPERENHSGITSAARFELLTGGPSVDAFSFNGWSTTRESSFGFSAMSASCPITFTHVLRHSSETLLSAGGASGGGVSVFGNDVKTYMTRFDPAGHQLIFLTSEFWHCWTNSLLIRLIRLLKPWKFPTQLS
jgi:hypothetical protein